MGHYACDMRPEWFGDKPDAPPPPKDVALKLVDDWMGELDVVLKKKAYKELVQRIAEAIAKSKKYPQHR